MPITFSKAAEKRLKPKQKQMYQLLYQLEDEDKDWAKRNKDSSKLAKLQSLFQPKETYTPRNPRKDTYSHYEAVVGTTVIADGSTVSDIAKALEVSSTLAEGYRSRRNNKNPKGIVIMKIGDCCQIGEHCGKHKN
ncbi:hypothetical protein [Lentilactobacillus kribbianus]|uniref:hypothetical protein n=1 Tax=Lentilactobacillus kribbianus TaxID=2729622 RepID=UPI001556D841|nr:hypothetical protein [Lentilactobacillus kribbianus]